MSEVWAGAQSRIERLKTMSGRATPGPMLVRVTVLAAACASMALAFSPTMLANPVAFFLVFAALAPAVFPRGPWPTGAIVVSVVGWLASTSIYQAQISVWRLSALAITLYVVHAAAALAAVLPYDSVISPGVFRPLIIRAGVVSVLTVVVAVFVEAIPSFVGKDHRLVLATLGGFVLMITMAIYLSFLGNRRQ